MSNWKEITLKGVTFSVSDLGEVMTPSRIHTYSRTRNGKVQIITRERKGQMYAPQSHHTGYKEICLRQNGVRSRIMAHRLVALAHVDGFQEGLCVNHINGVKSDNRACNLEWVSVARNTEHAWEIGLVNLRGENQPTHKLTSKQVVYIRKLLHQGIPAHTLAIIAGVSQTAISLIRDGKRWANEK